MSVTRGSAASRSVWGCLVSESEGRAWKPSRTNAEAVDYQNRIGCYVPLSIRYGTDEERRAWEDAGGPAAVRRVMDRLQGLRDERE